MHLPLARSITTIAVRHVSQHALRPIIGLVVRPLSQGHGDWPDHHVNEREYDGCFCAF